MSLVDMRINVDDYLPKVVVGQRRSTTLSPFHPFMIIDGRSSNYTKLPEEPLKLTVLKLDGSCFATIAELRQAAEAVFSHMPQKGPGKISWPHVWSHFCLTYDGRKLLTETDYIRNYGIKDGDQLQFVRHISTSYTLRKKRATKRIAAPEQHKISVSRPNIYEEKDINGKEDNCFDVENGVCDNYYSIDTYKHKESKLASFLQRWYQFSKTQSAERSLKGSSPSRSAYSFLGCFKKIIKYNCDIRHCQRITGEN